jgi:ArsR family transcriptional regulator
MPREKRSPEDPAQLFRALGDPNRLRILRLLRERTYCVRMIAERVGISQPAASQHLRVLRNAGLVEGEKRGYYVHYSVRPEALKECGTIIGGLAPRKRRRTPRRA